MDNESDFYGIDYSLNGDSEEEDMEMLQGLEVR